MRLDPELTQIHADLQAAANRRNAQHSTGPITHEGKATSSLNALKTGLTGRTVLLHQDDLAAYRQHLQEYEAEYKPEALRERELVQSMADTQWRLQRIPRLEMAIYAQGRADNQPYCDRHGDAASSLLELGTYLKYEKPLRNLQLQEGRLQRRYDKEREELRSLQQARRQAVSETKPKAANAQTAAPGLETTSAAHGFVFSNPAADPKTVSHRSTKFVPSAEISKSNGSAAGAACPETATPRIRSSE